MNIKKLALISGLAGLSGCYTPRAVVVSPAVVKPVPLVVAPAPVVVRPVMVPVVAPVYHRPVWSAYRFYPRVIW